MIFKEGVKINGIKPECTIALAICDSIYIDYGQGMVVTSVTEGEHMSGSLHPVGFAFDLRTRDFMVDDLERIRQSLIEALTDEFDVVLEVDHFHIEFQPKS